MDDKLLMMLAFDSLLLELDEDYENLPDEVYQMIVTRVYESYGLEVTSKPEDIQTIRQSILQDARKYRDGLIKAISEEGLL